MEVFIDKEVHEKLISFYQAALSHHVALDEVTVINKINRLYDALDSLGDTAEIYSIARLKQDWISKGYREFICEDFHFAYQIYELDDKERIVRIHDVVHSMSYHQQANSKVI